MTGSSEGGARPASATRFEGACPILRVRDLDASIEHCQRVLGFKVDWREPYMAGVSRDGAHLMLCHGHQGHPGTWVWIGVEDAAAVHEEVVAAGATVRLPPTNYPWAREIPVEDPDGHVLRLGSEPKSDQPFSEWVMWYGDRYDRPASPGR